MAKTIEQLEKENKELRAQTKDITKKLKVLEATAPKGAKPIVEIDGVSYIVVGGERTADKVTTREELAADLKRCRQIIAMGGGLLKKVEINA